MIAFIPSMEFKGVFGGWFNTSKDGERVNYFAQKDFVGSLTDSDNAFALSAAVGFAAICTTLVF